MPTFNTALTNPQLTAIRSGYSSEQYLLTTPNNIVFQCQSTQTITSTVWAEFTYTGVTGSYSDVKQGQTVLVTTSSSDLTTLVFRGRVRKVPTVGTFYLNETSQNLTTSYYITVIDDYDIHEKLERFTATGVLYKDWDLTYTNLPPHIGNLQSSYVYSQYGTADATFSFAPNAYANALGATISTYLWAVGDGTITVGTSATQNITATFPVGQRWVRLTVTDSNGVSNYFTFEVWNINLNNVQSYVPLGHEGVSINASWQEGYNATVRFFNGVDSLLDNTRCTIFSIDQFTDGTSTPIVSNIDFVGRIKIENNLLEVSDVASYGADVDFTIEGFASQMGGILAPSVPIRNDTTPTAWGEINSPSLVRAVIYLLAWHSTALNVVALDFDATTVHTYVNDDLNIQQTGLLDSANDLLFSMNATMTFSPVGASYIARHGCYIPTADRSALTTVMDITVSDWYDINLERTYTPSIGQVIGGFLGYQSTSDTTRLYTSKAPAIAKGVGQENAEFNRQILPKDQIQTTDRATVAQRTANHYAYINPHDRITVTLTGAWRFAIPTPFQWWTFTIASTDTARGIAYTSGTRWLLQSIEHTHNQETGVREVRATFERETDSLDAQIIVNLIPDAITNYKPVLPTLSAYGSIPFDQSLNYANDTPLDSDLQGLGALDLGLFDALPPQDGFGLASQQPNANCGVYNVFAQNGSKATTFNTVLGDTYTITVQGFAQVSGSGASWIRAYDFTASDGGWTPRTDVSANPYALYSAGNGWRRYSASITQARLSIASPVMTNTLTSIAVQFSLQTHVIGTGGNSQLFKAPTVDASPTGTWATIYNAGDTIVNYTYNSSSFALTSERVFISNANATATNGTAFPTNLYITSTTLQGTGTPPSGATTLSSAYGDAAYYNWQSGGTPLAYTPGVYGFLVDGATPTWNEVYNPSHTYTTTVTGTGAPFVFSFITLDVANTTPTFFVVKVCGTNAT